MDLARSARNSWTCRVGLPDLPDPNTPDATKAPWDTPESSQGTWRCSPVSEICADTPVSVGDSSCSMTPWLKCCPNPRRPFNPTQDVTQLLGVHPDTLGGADPVKDAALLGHGQESHRVLRVPFLLLDVHLPCQRGLAESLRWIQARQHYLICNIECKHII